jgi:hypothetical protein
MLQDFTRQYQGNPYPYNSLKMARGFAHLFKRAKLAKRPEMVILLTILLPMQYHELHSDLSLPCETIVHKANGNDENIDDNLNGGDDDFNLDGDDGNFGLDFDMVGKNLDTVNAIFTEIGESFCNMGEIFDEVTSSLHQAEAGSTMTDKSIDNVKSKIPPTRAANSGTGSGSPAGSVLPYRFLNDEEKGWVVYKDTNDFPLSLPLLRFLFTSHEMK